MGRLKELELFIKYKANLDKLDKNGSTALHCVADFVEMKFELGSREKKDDQSASIYPQTYFGRVQVSEAPQLLEVLLRNGANPNLKDREGYTPLHRFAKIGDFESLKVLLDNGADPTLLSSTGESPLHVVKGEKAADIVYLLLSKGAEAKAVDKYGRNALYDFHGKQTLKCAQLLFEAGARVSNQSCTLLHTTPLEMALDHEDEALMDFFIANGGDINITSGGLKRTQLHYLAESSCNPHVLNCIRLFVKKGGQVDAQDLRRITPLWIASRNGKQQMSDLLLELGADPNIQNNKGVAPKDFLSDQDFLRMASFKNELTRSIIPELLGSVAASLAQEVEKDL